MPCSVNQRDERQHWAGLVTFKLDAEPLEVIPEKARFTPPGDPGRGGLLSVAVAAGVGARPDEAEGLLAAFDHRVVEEVGVDWLGEARVV